MNFPGKMIWQVLASLFEKPSTILYPYVKDEVPKQYRGKIKFYPEKYIGCKLCMWDCPSNAITIRKIGDKQFECEMDLDKCIYCAQCAESCPRKALEATNEFELAQLDRNKLKVIFSAEPEPKENPQNQT